MYSEPSSEKRTAGRQTGRIGSKTLFKPDPAFSYLINIRGGFPVITVTAEVVGSKRIYIKDLKD